MACDLETLFGQLSQALPARAERTDTFLLSSQTLPQPRPHLRTDRLIISKRAHQYWPSFCVDALWFQADKPLYRQLGLLIFFGIDEASVRLAQLCLNVGLPANPVTEYRLEGEGGYRGVGIHSAEVRLFLPGSAGWQSL